MSTATHVHCFEQAGLGKAPFRYVGMQHQEISYGQRVVGHAGGCPITTKPGGTCAYCGTYIVNMFDVESADGNRFHVGCECIRKTGDSGLIARVDADVKAAEAVKRRAKKQAQCAADNATAAELPGVAHILAEQPHPNAYFAAEGRTMFDYVQWLVNNGSKSTAAKIIRDAKKRLQA